MTTLIPSEKMTNAESKARKRGRPRTVKGAKIKDVETILRVAAELFSSKGYRGTTMLHVAARAGISKPTLYTYAKTKSDLLEGIFSTWMARSEKSIERALEQDSPECKLAVLISEWTSHAIDQRSFYSVFLGDDRELPAATLRKYREWSDSAFRRIRGILVEGQKSLTFSSDLDATTAAFAIIGSVNWVSRWYNPKGDITPQQLSERLLGVFCQGLFSAPARSRSPELIDRPKP